MSQLVAVDGQSLALGFGVTPAELPPSFHVSAQVQILTAHGFEPLDPGVNTGTPANPHAWGPEVGLALDWEAHHTDPGDVLYIVKDAKGSTGIAADPAELDWSPSSRHELFDTAATDIARAKAITGLPLSTVYFVQGHQDALSAAKAGAYATNEADLFAHIRAEWGDASTRIIFAGLSDSTGLPFADHVRQAQAQVAAADPLAAEVSSDGLSYQPDNIHLTGAGEIGLADRLYAAANPAPPPPPPQDPDDPPFHSLFGRSFGHGSMFGHWIA